MPVLTRLSPSPVVVDIRPGALDDLAAVLADQRISHSGKLAVAISGGTPMISQRWPGSSTKRTRLPRASVSATILVVIPPLERPMAWL